MIARAFPGSHFWLIAYDDVERLGIGQIPAFDMGVWTGDYQAVREDRLSSLLDFVASICECRTVAVDANYHQFRQLSAERGGGRRPLVDSELAEGTSMPAPGGPYTDLDPHLFFFSNPGDKGFEKFLMGTILHEEIDRNRFTH